MNGPASILIGRIVSLVLLSGSLAAQPRRIVSTTPSITEMLFALGLGDRVVGVTTYCHYPPEAARIAKIGSYMLPNVEAILSLRPDLVVIQANPTRLRDRLTTLRQRVLELSYESIPNLYRSIETIGEAAGVPERARSLNEAMRKRLEEIRRKASALPRRRMMFIVGRNPDALEGLIAVGKASYLNDLMEIAGGENVFGAAPAPYPKVSLEEVLARNPEVIIDMGDMAQPESVSEEQKRSIAALWSRYPSLAAVKRRAVFPVASDVYVVPGPRMVEAAREFARMLHPEAGF